MVLQAQTEKIYDFADQQGIRTILEAVEDFNALIDDSDIDVNSVTMFTLNIVCTYAELEFDEVKPILEFYLDYLVGCESYRDDDNFI